MAFVAQFRALDGSVGFGTQGVDRESCRLVFVHHFLNKGIFSALSVGGFEVALGLFPNSLRAGNEHSGRVEIIYVLRTLYRDFVSMELCEPRTISTHWNSMILCVCHSSCDMSRG